MSFIYAVHVNYFKDFCFLVLLHFTSVYVHIFSHVKHWFSHNTIISRFYQADVQDNQRYPAVTSSLPNKVRYAAADLGYDAHKLYKFSTNKGFELVCPVSEIYNHTSSDRLQLIIFYVSELGREIYLWRIISVEPLIEHIKDVFKIDPLPVRGYQKGAAKLLLSVLIYQIMVYYNCITGNKRPIAIKHILGS
jgi:hypothetical protein